MASLRKASTRFNHLLWQQSPKCTNLSLVNGVKHMSSLETLGFIGLGNMGNHMARNLVKKGHKLVVFDVSKNAMKTIENMEGCENCVQTVNSPADVAAQCKHIITMLPATQHVQEVYTNRGTGIFSAIQENSLLVDSSTIDPAASQEMAAIAAEKDSSYVDAPVSGGVNAARDAALTFMVGGAPRSFEMAQKYLSVMGRNVVHCGPVGTGQAAKICNNMLLGISMIGTSEAMNLGKKLGLEPKLLAKILNTSSGRCWSSEVYNPCPGVLDGVPSSNNYEGGFGTALMTKDLGLANNAATVNKSPIPMGSLAHQIYRIMTSSGYAGKDFSSAYQFLQDQEEKS